VPELQYRQPEPRIVSRSTTQAVQLFDARRNGRHSAGLYPASTLVRA
jgi:hypothetical protein